jgi:hypothetical protein
VLVDIVQIMEHGLGMLVPMDEFGEKAYRQLRVDTTVPRTEEIPQLAMELLDCVRASKRFVEV